MKQCDSCKYWLPPLRGNSGVCKVLEQGKLPFWAYKLARSTISWEGKACATWKKHKIGEKTK